MMLVEFVTPEDERQPESSAERDAKRTERDAERMKQAFEKAGGII